MTGIIISIVLIGLGALTINRARAPQVAYLGAAIISLGLWVAAFLLVMRFL